MEILKAHGLILFATFLIAGSFIASENVTGQVHPVSLNLLRFVIASACLVPAVLLTPRYRRQIPSVFPRSFIISFFYCTYFVCLFGALLTTTVLNTGTISTLTPFITALLSAVFLKQRVGLKRTLVYLLGVLGTVWVVFKGSLDALQSLSLNSGDMLFMLGVFSMCGYTITLKLLYRQDSVAVLTCCTLLGGTIWMAIAALVFGIPLQWNLLTAGDYASMLYLAIGTTLVTSYLFQKASITLTPNNVTAYIYLSPACVAILDYVVNGNALSYSIMFGILISAVATVLLQVMSYTEQR
ncbi:DMT family transporter [Halodesulfovibrio marinisediminis]|uniref:EamA-like transporter family protein n=1 Tax=Halodesulfovibrio marinisediminis DSM 17456 TaxID=1121457 RepID=A0A1N6HYE1_9BACT|nr:DMT family transporter [Halodesulfovibrio marinisediminis]SIO24783.1 EamA-like transporter family protein [Halodesulfovibrio marinisediminis DSM 17456]